MPHDTSYLVARFGSRSLTILASLCLSVVLPLLALAPSLQVLVATLVLFGASFGSVNVAMNTQGVMVERHYGRTIFNSFHACYSIGGLSGALVGRGFMSSFTCWRDMLPPKALVTIQTDPEWHWRWPLA